MCKAVALIECPTIEAAYTLQFVFTASYLLAERQSDYLAYQRTSTKKKDVQEPQRLPIVDSALEAVAAIPLVPTAATI